MMTVHGVWHGILKGKALKDFEQNNHSLTHVSTDGGKTALCKKVKAGHLSDYEEEDIPSCPLCLAKAQLLVGRL